LGPDGPDARGPVARFLTGRGGLLVALGVALALRLPGLATLGYGVDEGNTTAEAIRLVDVYGWKFWDIPTISLAPLSGSMPVSYYWAALGLEAIGRDFVGLRVPFLLLGLASIALTWILARRLLTDGLVATIAALLLATNAAHVEYSQLARFYMPTLVLGLAWAIAFHALTKNPRLLPAIGLAAVQLLGFGTHHLFPLLGPIAIVYGVAVLRHPGPDARPDYRRRLVLFALGALVLSCAPLVSNAMELLGSGHTQSGDGDHRALRNVARAAGGMFLRIEPAMLLLASLGAWTAWKSRGRDGRFLVLLAFGITAQILMIGLLGQIRGRYVLWCLPYFAILAALATVRTLCDAPRRSALLVAGLTLVAFGLSTSQYLFVHADGRIAAGQVRGDAEKLAGDDALIVILGAGPPAEARAFSGWNLDRLETVHTERLRHMREALRPWLGRRLILVCHAQTEGFLKASDLYRDPRLRLVGSRVDATRRQSLHYAYYEWTP